MSLLIEETNIELKVDLLICKKGGTENYLEGEIVHETEKAIFVRFTQAGKEGWIPKRAINKVKDESKYFAKAMMWKPGFRVRLEPVKF